MPLSTSDNLKELLGASHFNKKHFHTYVKYFKVLIDYWVQYIFIHLYLKTIFTLEIRLENSYASGSLTTKFPFQLKKHYEKIYIFSPSVALQSSGQDISAYSWKFICKPHIFFTKTEMSWFLLQPDACYVVQCTLIMRCFICILQFSSRLIYWIKD